MIPIKRGVPQGAILSPILYSLYVHNFASIHPDIIQYVDDTTIIIPYKYISDLQTKQFEQRQCHGIFHKTWFNS